MNIAVPKSKRRKALLIIDVQKGFIKNNRTTVPNIVSLIKNQKYELYVEATFHAEKGSLWDKQTKWTFPYEPSVSEITEALQGKKPIQIRKETKSAFKGDKDLNKLLQKNGIEEVHIVGFDTNDCVFATAQEAFDNGFYTYIIEECTGSSGGKKLHNAAILILRELEMTNHSSRT